MTRFEEYCARGRAIHGDRFSAPSGSAWIEAYNQAPNLRIKVRFSYGEEKWGFVALTAGWRPCFMLMRAVSQRGSSDLLSSEDTIVARRTK
jgi:hypothetical protein